MYTVHGVHGRAEHLTVGRDAAEAEQLVESREQPQREALDVLPLVHAAVAECGGKGTVSLPVMRRRLEGAIEIVEG